MVLMVVRQEENQQDYMRCGNRRVTKNQWYTQHYWKVKGHLYKTYCGVGVEVLEMILLGALEIEG